MKIISSNLFLKISIIIGIGVLFIFINQKQYTLGDNNTKRELIISNCHKLEGSAQKECWLKAVDTTINYGGPNEAFLLVSDLYKKESSFGNSCHAIAHRIGETTYTYFSKGKFVDIPKNAGFCDFGFYHGFMEFLVSKGGNLNEARKFCDQVEQQSLRKKLSPNSVFSCYHGIGHGTFEVHNPTIWGNEKAMINPALKLCEKVSGTPKQLEICYSGVFNALQTAYVNHLYKLSLNERDPLSICRQYNKTAQSVCYPEMAFAYIMIKNYDFPKAAKFIEGMSDENYAESTMYNISSEFLGKRRTAQNDYSKEIGYCNSLNNNFKNICIKGIAYGLLANGEPKSSYLKALLVCNSNLLDNEEKLACYKQLTDFLYSFYTFNQADSICQSIDKKYINLCH